MFGSKENAVDGECPCLPVDGTIMEIGGESKHALCNINRNQSVDSKRSVVREKKRKEKNRTSCSLFRESCGGQSWRTNLSVNIHVSFPNLDTVTACRSLLTTNFLNWTFFLLSVIALESPLVGVKRSDVVVVVVAGSAGLVGSAGLAGVASALVVTAAEVPAMMVVGVVVVEGIPGTSVLTAGCEDAGVVRPWLAGTVVFWMTGSAQKMTKNFSLKILTNLNSSSLCGCLG